MKAKRGGLLAVACCLLLGAALHAEEIDYHKSFDAALEAAKESHQFVMVILVAPGKDPKGREVCKLLREETLPSKPIAKLIRQRFAPFLVDLAQVRAGKQAVPPVVQATYKRGERITVPTILFFDAKCRQVDKIVGYAPAEHYYQQIKKIADKALAAVPAKERRDLRRAVERGKDAFDRKDFNAAMEALEAALTGRVAGEDLDRARQIAREIQAKANEKYQEAQELEAEKRLGSAIRAYRECARNYKGTQSAKRAVERLVQLRSDPTIRKRSSDYRARKLLAQARAAVNARRYGAAADALDTILKRYAESKHAAAAKKLRQELDADAAIARRIREERVRSEAQRMLALAHGFRVNNMPKKAIAEYEKVVKKFPGTSFAKAAEQQIKELSRKDD